MAFVGLVIVYRDGPAHKLKIDISCVQSLQGSVGGLRHFAMIEIVKFGSGKDLLARDTGVFYPFSNVLLVFVHDCGVDVSASMLDSELNSVCCLPGF